ncbi:MAG TPA: hypothetical protein VFM05_08240 [Candidatus Saccharimonadales bacterium]|nr:hypothetical protein [Candidatus Saccharimonadales bacterium]
MEGVKRLNTDNVPPLKKVWIHNDDVIGSDEDGEPVILATLVGNDTGAGIINPQFKRARRKKKGGEVVKIPPEE